MVPLAVYNALDGFAGVGLGAVLLPEHVVHAMGAVVEGCLRPRVLQNCIRFGNITMCCGGCIEEHTNGLKRTKERQWVPALLMKRTKERQWVPALLMKVR